MIRTFLAALLLFCSLATFATAAPPDDPGRDSAVTDSAPVSHAAVTLDDSAPCDAPAAHSPMLASVALLSVAGVAAAVGRSLPNHAPTSVAALDERDPAAGNASHVYGIQYGGPSDMVKLQFQHGPRGIATSTAGVFEDDLLAILEDRIAGFQSGPFACAEHADAMAHIQGARDALARRVAARIAKGVLGVNEKH